MSTDTTQSKNGQSNVVPTDDFKQMIRGKRADAPKSPKADAPKMEKAPKQPKQPKTLPTNDIQEIPVVLKGKAVVSELLAAPAGSLVNGTLCTLPQHAAQLTAIVGSVRASRKEMRAARGEGGEKAERRQRETRSYGVTIRGVERVLGEGATVDVEGDALPVKDGDQTFPTYSRMFYYCTGIVRMLKTKKVRTSGDYVAAKWTAVVDDQIVLVQGVQPRSAQKTAETAGA